MPTTLPHGVPGFQFDVIRTKQKTYTLVVGWPTNHGSFQQPDEGNDDEIRLCHGLPNIEEAIKVLWQAVDLVGPSQEVRAALGLEILNLI